MGSPLLRGLLGLAGGVGMTATYAIHDRLTRKYLQAPTIMVDPYTEERDGALYLTHDAEYRTAILCDAIVDIQTVEGDR